MITLRDAFSSSRLGQLYFRLTVEMYMRKVCSFDGEEIDSLSGKNCKYCNLPFCIGHLQPEKHNCMKTRYAKYIRKSWLRKKGQNITTGHYVVTCDTCGYHSETGGLIEFAGQELESHLQSKGCQENNIFLDQTDEDELDKVLGMPQEQVFDQTPSWMHKCLKEAQNIVNTYHLQQPEFFSESKFSLFIQTDIETAYGYIQGTRPYYRIGLHPSLSEDTLENHRMVTIVLVHELLHAIHHNWGHDRINPTERLLANKAGYFDALNNMDILYLSGKMRLCDK